LVNSVEDEEEVEVGVPLLLPAAPEAPLLAALPRRARLLLPPKPPRAEEEDEEEPGVSLPSLTWSKAQLSWSWWWWEEWLPRSPPPVV